MVAPASFDTKNTKTNNYLNVRKLWFTFALRENATLEITLCDKLPNIMLTLGCRKEKRVSSFNSTSPNYYTQLSK